MRGAAELARLVGEDAVLTGSALRPHLHDSTETRGLRGHAEAAVLPRTPEAARAVVEWAYAHDVALCPQGGRTGFAGGAVPDGGIVLALDALRRVRALDPECWRIHVDAGVTTRTVQRLARENGLYYPPDPGAAEQSQIGGNIATNAGGPHAFKYGVTGAWVTGLEAVVAPGELIEVGGALRKDVGGYDLKSLLIGSEGTLAVITGAWLRLIPAPEAALPVVALYGDAAAGAAAVSAALVSGAIPTALEYIDGEAAAVMLPGCPFDAPSEGVGFVVIAEADGTPEQAEAERAALAEALGPGALVVHEPTATADIGALWRWREGMGYAVEGVLGGKVSEDIVVPIDRLREAVEETRAIGERHGLRACSWGHAGDGNLHSTFLVSPENGPDLERAEAAAEELFALAGRLEGAVSGEHGLGTAKSGQLHHQWNERATALHTDVKRLFDPKGLLNPGKKLA